MDVKVIVSASNTLNDIKVSMLRKVLLGEQSVWGNRLTIELFLPPSGTVEQEAVLRVVEMTAPQFKQYWLAKVFHGEAPAEPRTVSSGDTPSYVSGNPGAIALFQGASVGEGLTVLTVDGIAPGEEGYPLR